MTLRWVGVLAVLAVLFGFGMGLGVRFVPDRWAGTAHLSLVRFAELLEGGHWIGPKEAPVVILVYQDYLCGYSAELYHTLSLLRERYPQHVAVVVKNPVAPDDLFASSARVALGAECAADQNAFITYHGAAFERIATLSYRSAPEVVARAAGVPDMEEFEACLSHRRHGRRVAAYSEEAKELGVVGSPISFVNGVRIVGSVPLDVLDQLVAGSVR